MTFSISPNGQVAVVAATVVGTPQQLLAPVLNRRVYWRVVNLSNSGTLWLSKSLATPAAGLAGCYPLAPGAFEEFTPPGFVPNNGLWAISDGSTIQVTVETAV